MGVPDAQDRAGRLAGGKVDTDELRAELNRMGQEGWELVNAFRTASGHGASREVVAIFKRPLS